LGEKFSPSGEDFRMHAAGIAVQFLNFNQLPHAGFFSQSVRNIAGLPDRRDFIYASALGFLPRLFLW
jgi:hypothetical protein